MSSSTTAEKKKMQNSPWVSESLPGLSELSVRGRQHRGWLVRVGSERAVSV